MSDPVGDVDRDRSGATSPVCPDCQSPFRGRPPTCRRCGAVARRRDGVLSVPPGSAGREGEGWPAAALDRLAERATAGTATEAAACVAPDHEDGAELLAEIHDVRRDPWLALVGELLSGPSLVLNAGFGRRARTLAEHVGTVYAVDPSASRLRFLAAREGNDGVVPVHTTEDRLPFRPGSFGTIVADLTVPTGETLRRRLERLPAYLADGGSLLALVDGWPRRSGATELLGVDGPGRPTVDSGRPCTPSGYRAVLSSFERIESYALVPTADRPWYVFESDDDRAAGRVVDYALGRSGWFARLGRWLPSAADRLGLLERAQPSYLLVCTNGGRNRRFERPLAIAGRARTVVIEGDDGAIWKLPNCAAHEPFTATENALLARLSGVDAPITATLPRGRAVETEFGQSRREQRVDGEPLSSALDGSADAFETVLRRCLDWLAAFQSTFGGDPVVRTPAAVRRELRFEPAGIEPPPIDAPVETFETPVHGDFIPTNVHAVDGEVSAVIDWEYGAPAGSPVVDAGVVLLDTASRSVGGHRTAIDRMLCEPTDYRRRAREVVGEYCEAVGLPVRTVERYLPAAYLHRLAVDRRHGAASVHTEKARARARLVEYVFDRHDEIDLTG